MGVVATVFVLAIFVSNFVFRRRIAVAVWTMAGAALAVVGTSRERFVNNYSRTATALAVFAVAFGIVAISHFA